MTFLRSSLHLQLLHFHPHHPLSCKEGTIYSQALRYNMIISEYNIFQEELNSLTSILLARAHPHHLIIKNIQKVLIYTHSNLLSQRTPHIEKKNILPIITSFSDKDKSFRATIHKNWHTIDDGATFTAIWPSKPLSVYSKFSSIHNHRVYSAQTYGLSQHNT